MSPLDVVFGIIIIGLAIRCTFKGFIAEFMAVAAVLGGLVAGFLFFDALAALIERFAGPFYLSTLIAFLVIFLLFYLLVKMLENMMYRLVDRINLSNLDRALGMFLGLFEGAVLVLLCVFIMLYQPFVDFRPLLEESVIASIGIRLLPLIQEQIPAGDFNVR